jgi:hypothetical protein
MFGKLLSKAIKTATLPVDIAESGLDMLSGGDGSEESKESSGMPRISEVRDAVCEGIEEVLDDDSDD